MKQFMIWLVCLAVATTSMADEAEPQPPKKSDINSKIIFPVVPVLTEDDIPAEDTTPEPKPPRTPKFVSELAEDVWLVIESPDPLVITSSPLGHVTIQPEEGPLKMRGKFADGTGGVETRTYVSKYLYSVNAVKPGTIEIIVFNPNGVTEEKDILRYTLHVMGVTPIPPPEPEPGPKPEPDPGPMPAPTADNVLIEVVEDTLNRTPDTAIVLNALAGWNELKDKGHDWRIYDKKTAETKGRQAVLDAGQTPLPAMIVRDLKTGKILRVLTLPVTIDSVKRVISELTGGV